ncbi:response regulator [Novosphingopyxis sp.]|uniref:response regulator n=1 Tax=Novosphingopyxis sp. TaxID=2709690 RepID=UPI003B59ACB7
MAHIIIADDDEIVTDIVSEAFRSYGHSIGVVGNGEDALGAISAKSPDLVILDCNMPKMGGLNALHAIRTHPKFYRVPIMMLTGNTSSKDQEIALYTGADAYITKPFDPDFLVFEAEDIIAKHRQAA